MTVVEKPAEAPTTGNLGGQVRSTRRSLSLAGAEILLTGPDGAVRRVVADADGKWAAEALPPGAYKVHVSAPGFSPIEVTEDIAAGEATEATYRLAAEVKPSSKAIEVTVNGTRPPREVTKHTIERREMMRIPGTSGDALRSIQSLPGVARPPGLAGLLIVRGSAPQDTAYFIDGADVPLIYHFGGLSSAFPTELLDRIDFYPGNFSARYGTVMGGIVDVALKSPDTRCTGDYGKPTDKNGCFHAMAQADLIDTRALVQGQMGNWSFAAGGRRSWVDTWLKPVLTSAGAGVTTAPVYYDYQLIAETKPTSTSRLSLRFFGSDDRLKVLITDPIAEDPGFGGNLDVRYRASTAPRRSTRRSSTRYGRPDRDGGRRQEHGRFRPRSGQVRSRHHEHLGQKRARLQDRARLQAARRPGLLSSVRTTSWSAVRRRHGPVKPIPGRSRPHRCSKPTSRARSSGPPGTSKAKSSRRAAC